MQIVVDDVDFEKNAVSERKISINPSKQYIISYCCRINVVDKEERHTMARNSSPHILVQYMTVDSFSLTPYKCLAVYDPSSLRRNDT